MGDKVRYFTGEELTSYENKIYDMKLPPLDSSDFARTGSQHMGAAQIVNRVKRLFGKAGWLSDKTTSIPQADAATIEQRSNIAFGGIGFSHGLREIRAAQFAGRDLRSDKAEAARRAIDEQQDTAFWLGSESQGIVGFAAGRNIPRAIVDTDEFFEETATSAEASLNAALNLANLVRQNTKRAGKALTMGIPSEVFYYWNSTRMNV
jgi:hypothetical protein